MMKRLFVLFSALFLFLLSAGGEEALRIGNASVGIPLEPLRFALLLLNEKEPALRITFTRCEAKRGLQQLAAGELDLLLIEERSVPEKWEGERFFYGAQALVCYKNTDNPVTNLSLLQLREIWREKEPTWAPYSQKPWNIQRIGVDPFHDDGLERSFLPPGREEPKIFRVRNVRHGFPFLSPAALLCGPYVAERSADYPAVAVEGIAPDTRTILSGKYPLSLRYVFLCRQPLSKPAAAFRELWNQDASYRAAREAGLILAAPQEGK